MREATGIMNWTCGTCDSNFDTREARETHQDSTGHGVRRAAANRTAPASRPRNTATEKQFTFIRTLLAERAGNEAAEALRRVLNTVREDGRLTKEVASEAITSLLEIPKNAPAEAPAPVVLAKGDIHVVDGKFVRIHISQSSGQPYACTARIITEAIWDGDTLVTPGEIEWDFAKGLVNRLTESTKATPEQVKQFSRPAGRCIYCSRAIDTKESVAVGYGPVCAQKYGLPWGSTTETVAQTKPDLHDDPCVCGPYDRCKGVRAATATSLRDLHRAYND